MPKTRLRDMPEMILDHKPFKGSSMSAVMGAVSNTGRMPEDWAQIYREGAKLGSIAYTVLSYATPIAWVTHDHQWVVPPVSYSATTSSRHMPRVKEAMTVVYYPPITELSAFGAPQYPRALPSPHSGEGAIYSPEYLCSKTPAALS